MQPGTDPEFFCHYFYAYEKMEIMSTTIEQLTTFLIDLDGVVYRGNQLIPGAKEFILWLNANAKKYLFLTNNSFASETQVIEKLGRLGIVTDRSHVLGAGQAAVQIIAQRKPGASVFVVGEGPLTNLVKEHGMKIANEDWRTSDAVLVGLDRALSYQKLNDAIMAVRNGADFIAINRDPLLPVAEGVIAGCGVMVGAIEGGSEITPEVVGKPEPMLLEQAMHQLDSKPEETIMIGDNNGIDVKAGLAAHTHTMLVFSGKDTPESLAKSTIRPEFVYDNLAAVMEDLKSRR
jgi:HAD superfamily hydrolase (TIGR01457 family)